VLLAKDKVADDARENVVEVARDAAGELTDGLHFLRLAQLGLEPLALGFGCAALSDVARDGRHMRSAHVHDRQVVQLEVEGLAVLAQGRGLEHAFLALHRVADAGGALRHLVWRQAPVQGLADHFGMRDAVHLRVGPVHVNETNDRGRDFRWVGEHPVHVQDLVAPVAARALVGRIRVDDAEICGAHTSASADALKTPRYCASFARSARSLRMRSLTWARAARAAARHPAWA
jgi:hypothetical protein